MSRPNQYTSPSETTTAVAAPAKPAKFVPCPRSEYSSEHLNDWITFRDTRFKNFDICPSCFSASIALTRHAASFARAARKAPGVGYNCHFSRYWVRIAWAWIIASGAQGDAHLLAKVAAVDDPVGPCPNGLGLAPKDQGKIEDERVWYTISHPDNSGALVHQFTVCRFCITCIYTILPAVQTASPFLCLSEVPHAGICHMLSGTTRTTSYIDALMSAESAAQVSGTDVDMDAFKHFVLRFGSVAECSKDEPTIGNFYHIPQLPKFKVCEECYEDYVKPSANTGSRIALCFDSPVYAEDGFVCQLYSDRMRNMWSTAVANNDMEYLHKQVMARAAKETDTIMEISTLEEHFALLKQRAESQEQMALEEQMAQNSQNQALQMSTGQTPDVRLHSHFHFEVS
jgi:hypothetical protein